MDFSSFGDEQWEVKSWVNSAFSEVSREKRDSHAASLLTKLQLVAQDIAKSIEEASEQGRVRQTFIPKSGDDLDR